MEEIQLLPWVLAGVGSILSAVSGAVAFLYKQQIKSQDLRASELKESHAREIAVVMATIQYERAEKAAVDTLLSQRHDKYESLTEGNIQVLQSLDKNIENLVAELRSSRGGGIIGGGA